MPFWKLVRYFTPLSFDISIRDKKFASQQNFIGKFEFCFDYFSER